MIHPHKQLDVFEYISVYPMSISYTTSEITSNFEENIGFHFDSAASILILNDLS